MERRLAAILAADVSGFSRLMGQDESGTLARVQTQLHQTVEPRIAAHGGRIVKLMGDGLLAEFSSTVNAVTCAIAIQRTIAEQESGTAEADRLRLRMGINLGDVMSEGEDIFGDGVNVAARLEALAKPGGICISAIAHESLGNRVEAEFTDTGSHQVKNIDRPIRVYEWLPAQAATPKPAPAAPSDKPSIAVLPFDNMSGDPEQDYFSDGITEDIITELARFNSLFVIARNSSFHYKGKTPRIQDVGRELGVRYVVEGSVRKSGNRVRVTAQLIEAATENHLWAERYDRELEDIFAVQDDVVREIAVTVPGQVDSDEIARMLQRPAENPTAYDLLLRGEHLRHQSWGSHAARRSFEAAVEADPRCARAYAHLSNWHAYSILAEMAPMAEAQQLTRDLADKALLIEANDPAMLGVLAEGYLMAGELASARRCIDKAIKLNPNSYLVMLYASVVLAWLGEAEASLRWAERFQRHDPLSVEAIREAMFEVYYLAERFADAVEAAIGWINPPVHVLAEIAAAYGQLGDTDQAAAYRQRFEAARPLPSGFPDYIKAQMILCGTDKLRQLWLDGYRKSGFDC